MNNVLSLHYGEAGGVVVLPWRCTTMSPGSIPAPSAVCTFGFQSILASAGFFSPGSLVFFLHLKLGFLTIPISGNLFGVSASANC